MIALVFMSVLVAAAADPVALFNGKNLDGWKEASKDKAPLAGKTEAFGGRFKVQGGMIVIDPSVKGDLHIETEKAVEALGIFHRPRPTAGGVGGECMAGVRG